MKGKYINVEQIIGPTICRGRNRRLWCRRFDNAVFMVVIVSAHGDVIKWKHFPRYWPFVQGIHRWPVNSPHKGQWRGALMFSLICAWINGWVNNREAGDLRRHRAHYDFTVMHALLTLCGGTGGPVAPSWQVACYDELCLVGKPYLLSNKQPICRWYRTPWH